MTTDATAPVLGWLGTGRMGAAMARRLIDEGESVSVWNRTKSKTAPLVARGATAVDRIADLGSCDVVFVNSRYTAEDVSERAGVPRERIRIAYPGVDEEFRPDGPRREGRPYAFTTATPD